MKTVLTIAGSDSCGVGGIQADIKTITAHGLYASSVITSMTAQNTTGVYDIQESTPKFLGRQLECVFDDIFPDAVKVGMVSNDALINVIVEKLSKYKAKNVVLDTTIVSSGGRHMVGNKAEILIIKKLLPLGSLLISSTPEAEAISGIRIRSSEDMAAAAGIISTKYSVKGIFFKDGHKITDKGDMLFENGKITWVEGNAEDAGKSIGKGCALSAAIACHLASGTSLYESVKRAKQYMLGAVEHQLELGKGRNPVNHMYISQN